MVYRGVMCSHFLGPAVWPRFRSILWSLGSITVYRHRLYSLLTGILCLRRMQTKGWPGFLWLRSGLYWEKMRLEWNCSLQSILSFCVSHVQVRKWSLRTLFATKNLHVQLTIHQCNVPVKSKLQHPLPGQPPGIWILGKSLFKFPPSPGWKAVKMPPPARAFGGRAGAYFTDSGW